MPQGCMGSSEIFQGHMNKIFYDFEDIIVYIDNIILLTKTTFEHNAQHLSTVLDLLQAHNLHVHIEEIRKLIILDTPSLPKASCLKTRKYWRLV
jgi:hypothetical protein